MRRDVRRNRGGQMRHARERGDPRKFKAWSLLGWWRADLGITLNSGNVSAWADQGGAGNNMTQGTASLQPLYATAAQYGMPSIRGDGVDDTLSASFAHNQPVTRLSVWKATTLGTSGVSDAIMAHGPNKVLLIDNTAPQTQIFNGAFLGPAASTNSGAFGQTTEVVNGVSSELRRNRSSTSGDTGANTSFTGIFLWHNGGFGRFSNTETGEIAVYNSALSPSAIWRIESYQKARWAV